MKKITRKELRKLMKEAESKSAPFGSGMSQAKLDQAQAKIIGHTWLTHGKIRSESYRRSRGMDGLSQVGEVVWHTLDDHGIVETYDLRFGDFVVPNVPSALVEAVHYESHESKGTGHGKKDKLIKESKSILSVSEYLRLIKM